MSRDSRDQRLQALGACAEHDARPLDGTRGLTESRCELLRVVDLCQVVGRSDRTVRRMVKRGDLPRPMQLSGPLCWSRRAIRAWLERQ